MSGLSRLYRVDVSDAEHHRRASDRAQERANRAADHGDEAALRIANAQTEALLRRRAEHALELEAAADRGRAGLGGGPTRD